MGPESASEWASGKPDIPALLHTEALYSEYADSDTVRRPCADGPAVRRDGKRQSRTSRLSLETACLALVFRDGHSIDSVRPRTLSVPNRTDPRRRAIHYSDPELDQMRFCARV